AEEDVTFQIVSAHLPLLFKIRFSSLNEPLQAFPKLPVSAMARASFGSSPTPATVIVWGPNRSLLKMVMVPAFAPALSGLKRMITSIESPGLIASGYEATLGASKSAGVVVM